MHPFKNTFKNILVVTGSGKNQEVLLTRAIDLVKNNRAVLTVAEVIEEIPGQMQKYVQSRFSQDLQHGIFSESRERLEQLLAPLKEKNIPVEAKILSGRPFIAIIRDILRNNRDLLIMAHEQEKGLQAKIFTSTIQHLMRKCPCPVWLIKPGRHEQSNRILVAVDPVVQPYEDPDPARDELNVKLLEMGQSMARPEKSELFLFNAWMVLFEGWMNTRPEFMAEYIEELRSNKKLEHKRAVVDLAAQYAPGVRKKNIILRKGEAGRLIPRIVRDYDIDLLVMGTVSRTGISGLLIGNTAEQVLNDVECSVLAVKPDGFMTPVTL